MSLFAPALLAQAEALLAACRAKSLTLTTAESCTGGLIAGLITSISGASDVFTHGFVTYANDAKTGVIHVPAALIATHGAVSEEVARAMAEGAREVAASSMAVSVTGVAGPGGGSAEKPVGLVHIACVGPKGTEHARHVFSGDREAIRLQAVAAALTLIAQQIR